MRVAIVHDYLNQFGGAERVVSALNEIFPQAPIYTSIFNEARLPDNFRRMDIRTSFMQNIPYIFQFYKLAFPLYPPAFERLDLNEYDVIFSSSSAYAKGIKKSAHQLHICYCYTPMRFVWRYDDYVKRESLPEPIKAILPFLLEPIKKWDLRNSRRVDYFVAISRAVAGRIRTIYERESVIIYPPVETELFVSSEVSRDNYLVVSRLNAYKRIDIAIEAFNRLELPLTIIGDGPDRRRLEKMAGPTITFLGRQSDEAVARHLAECRALVFPGEEDFGIAPLEAMACGRPVIAYMAGGALETVIEGMTGLFFDRQTPAALMQAIKRFQFTVFEKNKLRAHALKFDKAEFKRKIERFVNEKYEEKFGRRP